MCFFFYVLFFFRHSELTTTHTTEHTTTHNRHNNYNEMMTTSTSISVTTRRKPSHRIWKGGTSSSEETTTMTKTNCGLPCASLVLVALMLFCVTSTPTAVAKEDTPQQNTHNTRLRALRKRQDNNNKAPQGSTCIAMGDQCGGMGFKASARACCAGYTCEDMDVYVSSCVLSSTAHKDLGSPANQTPLTFKEMSSSSKGQAANYDQALYLSLLFYESQRSGALPATKRVPWRADSFMDDQGKDGEDLTGGYFDGVAGGALIKFGLPMAWSTTVLAWGYLSWPESYTSSGETEHLFDALRWGLDYFVKAHTAPDELYVQVGDQADLAFWSPPEMSMPAERRTYKVTCQNPGSEPVAETAAAMAAGALVFQGTDPAYANKLLEHAKQLYDFADRCRGNYVTDGHVTAATPFYTSYTGFADEIAWAATWLYKATGEAKYLKKAEDLYPDCCSSRGSRPGGATGGQDLPPIAIKARSPDNGNSKAGGGGRGTDEWVNLDLAFTYDDKAPGVQLMLYNLTGDKQYADDASYFLNSWLAKPRTQQGLSYVGPVPLPNAASASFLALIAADSGLNPVTYRRYARNQVNYMLGLDHETDAEQKEDVAPARMQGLTTASSSSSRSYLIGFGTTYPRAPAHRASSCAFQSSNTSCQCSTEPNFYKLYGALVGGPADLYDTWVDSCDDFQANQVSLAGNAGFQSAVAGLRSLV